MYYASTGLKDLRKTRKKLTGHLVSGQGFKPPTPDYKTVVLHTPQWPLTCVCVCVHACTRCLCGGKIHMHEYASLCRLKYILQILFFMYGLLTMMDY